MGNVDRPAAPSAATVLEQYVVAADWYRRCLEDVIGQRVVRGLDEARQAAIITLVYMFLAVGFIQLWAKERRGA